MVRLTDRPDITLDVYRGRKITTEHTHFYGCSGKNGLRYYATSYVVFSLVSYILSCDFRVTFWVWLGKVPHLFGYKAGFPFSRMTTNN